MWKISTQTHALLDLLTAGSLFAVANGTRCSPGLRGLLNTMAAGKLAYSLMTRHEMGLVKVIPMPVHLAMDAVSGAALAAAPLLMDEDDQIATGACVALGLGDIVAAVSTQTRSACDTAVAYDVDYDAGINRARAYRVQRPDLAAPDKGPEPVPTPNARIYDEGALPPAARRDTGAHATPTPGL
jgi:hypothetical protein